MNCDTQCGSVPAGSKNRSAVPLPNNDFEDEDKHAEAPYMPYYHVELKCWMPQAFIALPCLFRFESILL
ncbi:hypothetical protein D9619_006443 [Psilocybe cf. subviscida]|uniref:Uncharacterized protein n=1 Tax=Psilocybe cf. subviscida TaxID=2480587 RepID=A0A8H5B5P2_9AGAR|nr:hypothetical protein D9619_006443 [Psilocybe cf. subviscida]